MPHIRAHSYFVHFIGDWCHRCYIFFSSVDEYNNGLCCAAMDSDKNLLLEVAFYRYFIKKELEIVRNGGFI